MTTNGPAVGFSKRYPTTAPPQICPGRPESCHGARRVRRGFCHPSTSFNRRYACRGTKLISGANLSKCNKCYKMGTGAVSRYKFDRSQKSVTVQDLNCEQMRVSGCKRHYKAV